MEGKRERERGGVVIVRAIGERERVIYRERTCVGREKKTGWRWMGLGGIKYGEFGSISVTFRS